MKYSPLHNINLQKMIVTPISHLITCIQFPLPDTATLTNQHHKLKEKQCLRMTIDPITMYGWQIITLHPPTHSRPTRWKMYPGHLRSLSRNSSLTEEHDLMSVWFSLSMYLFCASLDRLPLSRHLQRGFCWEQSGAWHKGNQRGWWLTEGFHLGSCNIKRAYFVLICMDFS